MSNQKLEDILNLALETAEPVREKSLNLNVGYEAASNTWELIVKYNGDLSWLKERGITVEELLAGYAILIVPEEMVDMVAELEEIEYVEKPKRLFFAVENGKEASCILPVTGRTPYLDGEGVIVAVIDSGIDFTNRHFRNADGTTRLLYLWDQTIQGRPPEGFFLGTEYDKAQIDAALQAETAEERYRLVPSRDISGHGTAVAGIAAGVGAGSRASVGGSFGAGFRAGERDGLDTGFRVDEGGEFASVDFEGVAPASSLIVVKLGLPNVLSFPRTTEFMRAVTYVVRKAQQLQMPVSINVSFGNTYGAHDGTSLVERFLDNAAEVGRTVICVGSGNEGNSAGHVQGDAAAGAAYIEMAVSPYETALSVQLWKNYVDVYRIILRSPGGEETVLPIDRSGKIALRMEQTDILIYMGEPTPYAVNQEVYFDFIPVNLYLTPGVWTFRIEIVKGDIGQYYLYLPSESVRNQGTRFFTPNPQVTLTIPSTAQKVVTVGAYDSVYESYADFSGRGYVYPERTLGLVAAGAVKPDLAAPGVNITAPDTQGGYSIFTGTSFAAPFVTGSAALLMQWGIVMGNDPFLYGEKVKAYLRRGTRPLRGEAIYPNERVGFGALCVADSLPL